MRGGGERRLALLRGLRSWCSRISQWESSSSLCQIGRGGAAEGPRDAVLRRGHPRDARLVSRVYGREAPVGRGSIVRGRLTRGAVTTRGRFCFCGAPLFGRGLF